MAVVLLYIALVIAAVLSLVYAIGGQEGLNELFIWFMVCAFLLFGVFCLILGLGPAGPLSPMFLLLGIMIVGAPFHENDGF